MYHGAIVPSTKPHRQRSQEEREALILDIAGELFYARGVHEVGMDELVAETGLGKASVYRTFATKDELIGAYLRRSSARIMERIDADVLANPDRPEAALRAVFAAIRADVQRPSFRGCAFNNASIEFADPDHPARTAAREHRGALLDRLGRLAIAIDPDGGNQLAAQLALVIDGMYTSGAHLGPEGPAAGGAALADALIERAVRDE